MLALAPALASQVNQVSAASAAELVGPRRRGLPPPLIDRVLAAVPTSTTTTTTRPADHAAPPSPPATTTTTAPARSAPPSQTGKASWYRGRKGECAHRTLPIGTRLSVTNLGNGRTTECVVTNRGPYVAGRVVDLTRPTFAELADPSVGVIDVRLRW